MNDILISIIFGIVIGVLLYGIYNPPLSVHGPNSKDIVNRIFKYGGKKYRFDPIIQTHMDKQEIKGNIKTK